MCLRHTSSYPANPSPKAALDGVDVEVLDGDAVGVVREDVLVNGPVEGGQPVLDLVPLRPVGVREGRVGLG